MYSFVKSTSEQLSKYEEWALNRRIIKLYLPLLFFAIKPGTRCRLQYHFVISELTFVRCALSQITGVWNQAGRDKVPAATSGRFQHVWEDSSWDVTRVPYQLCLISQTSKNWGVDWPVSDDINACWKSSEVDDCIDCFFCCKKSLLMRLIQANFVLHPLGTLPWSLQTQLNSISWERSGRHTKNSLLDVEMNEGG